MKVSQSELHLTCSKSNAVLVKEESSGDALPLSETAFRKAEKEYKLTKPGKKRIERSVPLRLGFDDAMNVDTDFVNVVDFRYFDGNTDGNKVLMKQLSPGCFSFGGVPGLLFFPSALSIEEQQTWVQRSLDDFACSPPFPNNITNLNPDRSTGAYCPQANALRWATLGFSYDWSKKLYSPDRYSPFPEELREMILRVMGTVHSAGMQDIDTRATMLARDVKEAMQSVLCSSYEPQTAIVNYFPIGTMMCAHQDLSEPSLHRPLISISLGCSAIFLMGTSSRFDKPHAFILRSGDVVAFSGESRTAFHAVPRILDDCPSYLLPEGSDDSRIKGLRININVRQVYDEPQPCVREKRR